MRIGEHRNRKMEMNLIKKLPVINFRCTLVLKHAYIYLSSLF